METQLDLAIVGECEIGESFEPQEVESFEQFEEIFGGYEPEFIGLPPGFGDKILTYLRTKVSIPLSEVTEKIQLRHEIEKTINNFLDKNSSFNKTEYDKIVAHMIRIIRKYND